MEPVLVVLGVGVAAGIGVLAWHFSPVRRFRREMHAIPLVSLGDAKDGQPVRIVGTLRCLDDRTLQAPLSGRRCAAWRVVVERHRSRGKSSYWEKVVDESDSRSFLLEAGEEVALVDGTHLDLLVDFDRKEGTRLLAGMPLELEAFCRERGIDTTTWLGFSHTMRYREGVLDDRERVAVAGVGRWLQDPTRRGRGYRDVGRRFELGALPDGRLLCTDHPDVV